MNCVATINIGDIFCDNARKSIDFATSRWNVDFVEVKKLEWPKLHPCFTKFALIKKLIGYEKVLYIDSDILIRSDAPNPFELYKSDPFCAVHDIHSDLDFTSDYFWSFAEYFLVRHMRVIKKHIDINLDEMEYIKKFFNAGVMLFDPRVISSIIPDNVGTSADVSVDVLCSESHYEQALMNYYIQKSEIPIRYLDKTWNRIDPDISGVMTDYIYHFTGMKRHLVRPVLPTYSWKVS